MAIFGDLSDLPFPEVLSMLGRRTGRLEIVLPDLSEKIEVHLEQGVLRGVRANGRWLDDPLWVRDRLTALMDAECGCFDFHREEAESLHRSVELSIPQLLLSIAAAVDEISHYRRRFAHPETRFVVLGREEVWLDQDLYDFLTRAEPRLLAGVNASELAGELGLSIEQVQLNLYKLRSVGRVAPLRSFAALTGDETIAQPAPRAEPQAAEPQASRTVVPFERPASRPAPSRPVPSRPACHPTAARQTVPMRPTPVPTTKPASGSELRGRIASLLKGLKTRLAS